MTVPLSFTNLLSLQHVRWVNTEPFVTWSVHPDALQRVLVTMERVTAVTKVTLFFKYYYSRSGLNSFSYISICVEDTLLISIVCINLLGHRFIDIHLYRYVKAFQAIALMD